MTEKCPYCADVAHAGVCPMVKAIEYRPDGTVKRVEFKCAADWATPMNEATVWSSPSPYWSQTKWGTSASYGTELG